MITPLKITNTMREEHKARIEQRISRVNENIKHALENGQHETYFPVDKDNADYQEVRKIFEEEGYHIKPTGYIGGVWQETENICW